MKKLISLSLILMLLIACMASCELADSLTGAFEEKAESSAKIDEMIEALATDSIENAKRLMHPGVLENADSALLPIIDFLDGRTVKSKELRGINIRNEVSTSGNTSIEELSYKVTLSDDSIIYVSSVYVSDNSGVGFTAFNVSIGLI